MTAQQFGSWLATLAAIFVIAFLAWWFFGRGVLPIDLVPGVTTY